MWRAFTNGKPSYWHVGTRGSCNCEWNALVISNTVSALQTRKGNHTQRGGRVGTEKNFHWRLLAGFDSLEAFTVSPAEEGPSS